MKGTGNQEELNRPAQRNENRRQNGKRKVISGMETIGRLIGWQPSANWLAAIPVHEGDCDVTSDIDHSEGCAGAECQESEQDSWLHDRYLSGFLVFLIII